MSLLKDVITGVTKTIEPLQRVQKAAARLVLKLGPCDHVTSALQQLHWLPVSERITYKLCLRRTDKATLNRLGLLFSAVASIIQR